jgi:hypothetical protein
MLTNEIIKKIYSPEIPLRLVGGREPTKEAKRYDRKREPAEKRTFKETRIHNAKVKPVVCELLLDGKSYRDIMMQCDVSNNFIADCRRELGIKNNRTTERIKIVKDLVMNAPAYYYQLNTLADAAGIEKNALYKVIQKIPQIEKGKEAGKKNMYLYNFDVKYNDGLSAHRVSVK